MDAFLRDCEAEEEGEKRGGAVASNSDKGSRNKAVIDIEDESDSDDDFVDAPKKDTTKKAGASKDGTKQLTLKCCGPANGGGNNRSRKGSQKSKTEPGMTAAKRKKEAYMFFYVKSSVIKETSSPGSDISLPPHVQV